uniref:Uncharacterized protein n=1 Tax=Octopus bimaculoides TaxID=37653 RepID=A0A0L8FI90_OCTBM
MSSSSMCIFTTIYIKHYFFHVYIIEIIYCTYIIMYMNYAGIHDNYNLLCPYLLARNVISYLGSFSFAYVHKAFLAFGLNAINDSWCLFHYVFSSFMNDFLILCQHDNTISKCLLCFCCGDRH